MSLLRVSLLRGPLSTSRRASGHLPWAAAAAAYSPKRRALSSTPPASRSPPLYFETGIGAFAKRASRPFPPPFVSLPSGSFSEPLSTHNRSRDRRPSVNGEHLRGITNGDDAIVASDVFIGANDGVGAWAERPRGHAALWSRLVLHFWTLEVETHLKDQPATEPDPVEFLQRAYEQTKAAVSVPNEWNGTTTACGALLFQAPGDSPPSVYVTNLGDCKILVLRPTTRSVLYRTTEQWHWFDCPRQLGTNSPDTPRQNAVCDKVDVEAGDVVLAMSDGVVDNLWEHEVVENVLDTLDKVRQGRSIPSGHHDGGSGTGMDYVAKELVWAARVIAQDPFAESPFMERAVDEGLAMEGGKPDDISVAVALCKRREG